ncbi:hypothetical protein ONS96_001126 [Cadophora gregata f. sp. sojae]|nr:hypothetical protein ONS96_001126 [Cadophora gregata f. sp. sojae]
MIPAGALGATALNTCLSSYGNQPSAVQDTGPFTKHVLQPGSSLARLQRWKLTRWKMQRKIPRDEVLDQEQGLGSGDSDDDGPEDSENYFYSVEMPSDFLGGLRLVVPGRGKWHIGRRLVRLAAKMLCRFKSSVFLQQVAGVLSNTILHSEIADPNNQPVKGVEPVCSSVAYQECGYVSTTVIP